ncbi:MAG: CCA tRNA nucleotidyltransferase [Gemmatimonadetes bacterium]|nr:CCA tRNA nucleotidyltransferase [Gemmatimonadota bacterium]
MRDALLGRSGGDWDLATDARPERVRAIFRRTVPIGIEHGTVGVFGRDRVLYEVTTFRRDVETFGRHAVVEFADSLDEDLARRDFTINAIAWDPVARATHDPYDGISDLRAGRLRTVGAPAERMGEDYLRVLRALRFAGHYGLTIDPDTWQAIRDAVPRLEVLSPERVREEIGKVLGKTRPASATLRLYHESGALEQILPEVAATAGLRTRDSAPDAWSLALTAIDHAAPSRVQLRTALLLHAVGMPGARTRDLRGGWRFTGHEALGGRLAEEIMRRLRASNAEVTRIATLVAKQSFLFPPDAPDAGVRRWLRDVTPGLVRDLFRLRIASWRADPVEVGDRDLIARWRKAHAVMLANPVLQVDGLAIDGEDLRALGLQPGPRYGEILRELLERVIESPQLNEPETLRGIVREGMLEP